MEEVKQFFRFNPALYWGSEITGFTDRGEVVWGDAECWAYDTHTARLFSFTHQEHALLEEAKHCWGDEAIVTSQTRDFFLPRFFKSLLEKNIFLARPRRIIFGNYLEAEVWIQSNHFCNLACPGCATGMDVAQERGNRFDLALLDASLKKIANDARERGFRKVKVKLGGGEPTLNGGEFVRSVAALCEKYSGGGVLFVLVLLTNGIALSDPLICALKECGVHVSVSTDPARMLGRNATRAFPLVLQHIIRMLEVGMSVSAQLTVSAGNASLISEVYESLTDLGVPIHFGMFRPQTKQQFVFLKPELIIRAMRDMYARVFQRIAQKKFAGNITSFDYLDLTSVKDGVCGAGKTYIVLDTDGGVYSCHEKIRSHESGGNIFTDDENVFDMIDRAHAVPKEQRYTTHTHEKEYPFVWQGGLGCPWVAEKEHGDFERGADSVIQVYGVLAPIMLALNVKLQKSNAIPNILQ